MKQTAALFTKNSKALFKAGQITAGNTIKKTGQQTYKEINTVAKGSIATAKLAVKGATVFGTVTGAKEGTNRVINYTQGTTESSTTFSLEECQKQTQELDSQTRIKQQMQNFKTTTENTIENLGERIEKYYTEYDEQKVDKSISKIPVASGVVAGVSKTTGSKEIVAASAATIDLISAAGPVAIASIVQNGVEKVTEEAVFTAGKLVIDTYKKYQTEQLSSKIKDTLEPKITPISNKIESPATTPAQKKQTSKSMSI